MPQRIDSVFSATVLSLSLSVPRATFRIGAMVAKVPVGPIVALIGWQRERSLV